MALDTNRRVFVYFIQLCYVKCVCNTKRLKGRSGKTVYEKMGYRTRYILSGLEGYTHGQVKGNNCLPMWSTYMSSVM